MVEFIKNYLNKPSYMLTSGEKTLMCVIVIIALLTISALAILGVLIIDKIKYKIRDKKRRK